ncbi:glycerol-3-phosphate dehydrogenase [Xanthomonas sacchari]|uniref:glycerol-3-phosphate dehydrogenase n=1 Tax=Xanthomonas TaxID=338 RepID=UPI001263E45E|nr:MULTISPECIES: glycerol-3-phosphate dehydrogenase [Xanthomonas]KAB7781287.1 glycerol-3-phosphate dehydrogenase [Xanthomonas sp. LMG 12459]MCW0370787.1 D-erythritol 1-phosphate dehydrogenase [Xanthomonas sacchari]MCW0413597.1 D-erythritol 1-phosphate dehydrogenase [Xanthomonas sacchari]UYK67153.1 glycerol-3-phosphate dehydrogenase [Xanthomonas sacchari]
MRETYDVLVVGGGINGVGIARDAVGRGLSVCLCERDDLAAHTSSASTKLIHGGLRYLEQYEFALVGKALAEREVLLRLAPHIIWPLRFLLPHQPHLRPAWMIRTGLFLYDHLGRGRRTLPGSRRLALRTHPVGAPLREEFRTGFVYSDAWVQDARLVVLNAMDAAQRGARILTRTRCVGARRVDGVWQVQLQHADGRREELRARSLVNAAGPWAVQFLDEVAHVGHDHALRLVKGSHIVVPRLFEHDHAYIFQQPDRRIVFAIPYEQDYTLIGTTDVDYHADPAAPRIDGEETRYLCEAANRYFRKQIAPDDVVWSYSGVRPLLDDEEDNAAEVTRDYLLELDTRDGAALLNVFGGKLTTYRKLAEEAVDRLTAHAGRKVPAWTAHGAPLPGGERSDIATLARELRTARPWLPEATAQRLARNYGTRADTLLGDAASLQDLGQHFGADLYQAEVDYLREHEWVVEAEDLLWRRSKLGLRVDAAGRQRLVAYLQQAPATLAAAPA